MSEARPPARRHTAVADPATAYRGVPVAVLGATGFIGAWVARRLAAAGAELSLVARHEEAALRLQAELPGATRIVTADLSSRDAIAPLLEQLGPAVVFNLAGYGVDPSERDEATAQRINVELVEAACHAAAATRHRAWPGAVVVHAGSALEYGRAAGALREDAEPEPITLYGRTKLAGTRSLANAARALNLPTVTARLFTVYGPGEHAGRLLPALLETRRTGRPLDLTSGEQRRDFTYVADAAEGLLRLGAATVLPGEVVNLATGRLTSVRSFAETAAQLLGLAPELLRFGVIPTRGHEMRHDPVAIDRLRQLTGWAPTTEPATGIRATMELEQDAA